jgi:hypothetical protein
MSLQNNNDNNTTVIFMGQNKTPQNTRTPQEEMSARKLKDYILVQNYFNVEDENTITMEYFS